MVELNQRTRGKEILFVAYDPHRHRIVRRYTPNMHARCFVEFLKLLSRTTDEDIYLILDNHPSHRSREAGEVFAKGKIKPVWLPKHAPELNDVDKIIFSLLQREVIQNRKFRSLDEMERCIDRWIRGFNSSHRINPSLQN